MSGIAFAGRYEGSGVWYDEAGKSQTYTVVQTNTATSDGFEVAFKHDFADDTVVEARRARGARIEHEERRRPLYRVA